MYQYKQFAVQNTVRIFSNRLIFANRCGIMITKDPLAGENQRTAFRDTIKSEVQTMKTLCVTGHRPSGLPWGYRKSGDAYEAYRRQLYARITAYIGAGYTHFITGMALGVDMDFAEAVLALRETTGQPLTLECAIPCPDQTSRWYADSVARYRDILGRADKVTMLSDHYYAGCMHARNEYMVNHSDTVLAVWNGKEEGGTYATMRYVRRAGKPLDLIRV